MKNGIVGKIMKTNAGLEMLPVRVGLGVIMAAHGAQKLFGAFGGHGLEGTANFFESQLGLSPGYLMASLAAGGEFFGGILVLLGLLTRPAAAVIAGTMVVAIITVHPDAFFASNNGMEYPLMLLLAGLTLVIGGGGSLSVDKVIAKE